ncbi:MAG: DMT family transporter [Aminobacterium sp.]|nr:DMT family transporter [Aminobacterium sp.]MDD4551496.1 DMT family transporter [Aminobacterium sp.]
MNKTADDKPLISPFLVLFLGVLAISTGAIFARMAHHAHPLVISAYRVGIAAVVLLPLALWRCREEIAILSKGEWRALLLSGIFLAIHFAFWISSLFYTSVASSVVIADTIPIWTAFLAPIITHDKVSRKACLGIGVAFMGGIVISLGDFSVGKTALWGDSLALIGAWAATLYFLCGRIARRRVSLLTYASLCYSVAAVCLWGVILFKKLPVAGFSLPTWGAFLGMGLIPQILGHSSYNWALRYVNPSAVSVALLGEPVGSSILAFLLWKEKITLLTLAGGILILLGIFIVAHHSGRK